MISQENVTLIVTTCNLKEKGRTKCHQFWPFDTSNKDPVALANEKAYTEQLGEVGISVERSCEDLALTKHLILRRFTMSDTALGITSR